MATARPSGSTLLEKWLEGVPNSNNKPTVKKERKEFKDIFSSSSFSFNEPSYASPQNNAATIPSTSSSKSAAISDVVKTDPNQIDASSIKGAFGWDSVNDVALPIIFRDDERLVPVRIVETKIIGKYSNLLPWTVFSCINIKSYFITENEATLLNEINNVHCEYYFGYDTFTVKDVVVCLQDVFTLYKYLETSKDIFQLGLAKVQLDSLGFVNLSGLIVPYIGKLDASSMVRKYVPQSLIQSHVYLGKADKVEMNEWDSSYLRMLLIYSGLEQLQIHPSDSLIALSDLKYDSSLCSLHIEECSPPVTKMHPSSSSKLNVSKTDYRHHSSASNSKAHQADSLSDADWLLTGGNSSSPNPALRSLHQITRVDVGGVILNAINLKPYSNQQAVFVSDMVTKMFRGVSVLTAHYILEKILQVKLYECSRLHEDAFVRAGMRPLQGDKLVLVEVLRKCIAQLRHIIIAGLGGASSSNYGQM